MTVLASERLTAERFSEIAQLTPKQRRVIEEAISQPAAQVLAGGSGFGGKSYSCRATAVYLCLFLAAHGVNRPVVTMARSELALLRDNHAAEMVEQWGRFGEYVGAGGATGSGFRFKDQRLGVIPFRPTQEAAKRRGIESNALLIDEGTESSEADVTALQYGNRRKGPVNPMVVYVNPDGPFFSWVKSRWLPHLKGEARARELDRKKVAGRLPSSLRFVKFLPSDNPLWDERKEIFMANLAGLPEAVRHARLTGDWGAPEGARWPTFSEERNVYSMAERFPNGFPPEWPRFLGVDYGLAVPFAAIWGVVEPNGNIWLYRERYAAKVPAPNQAVLIQGDMREDEVMSWVAGDPAMWQETPGHFGKTGESVALAYAAAWANDRRFAGGLAPGQRPKRLQHWGYMDQWMDPLASGTIMVEEGMENFRAEIENAIHPLKLHEGSREKGDIDSGSADHALTALMYATYGYVEPPARFVYAAAEKDLEEIYREARARDLEKRMKRR